MEVEKINLETKSDQGQKNWIRILLGFSHKKFEKLQNFGPKMFLRFSIRRPRVRLRFQIRYSRTRCKSWNLFFSVKQIKPFSMLNRVTYFWILTDFLGQNFLEKAAQISSTDKNFPS